MPAFSVSVARPDIGSAGRWPAHHEPIGMSLEPASGRHYPSGVAYSERLMVKLPNTGASRWPLNSRVLW